MKKILIIACFSIINFCLAQIPRITYLLKTQYDSISPVMQREFYLEVDPQIVKFYDKLLFDKYIPNRKIDSKTMQQLTRKNGTNKNKQYLGGGNEYFFIESTDNIEWALTGETKNENEFKLQKATAKFGGRNWIAWFIPDIAIPEGPYKFRGLPGLIYEISDDKNLISYKMLNIENLNRPSDTSNILETSYGVPPMKTTLEKFSKFIRMKLQMVESEEKKRGAAEGASKETIKTRMADIVKNFKNNFIQVEIEGVLVTP